MLRWDFSLIKSDNHRLVPISPVSGSSRPTSHISEEFSPNIAVILSPALQQGWE